jgi:hypothetical protein
VALTPAPYAVALVDEHDAGGRQRLMDGLLSSLQWLWNYAATSVACADFRTTSGLDGADIFISCSKHNPDPIRDFLGSKDYSAWRDTDLTVAELFSHSNVRVGENEFSR